MVFTKLFILRFCSFNIITILRYIQQWRNAGHFEFFNVCQKTIIKQKSSNVWKKIDIKDVVKMISSLVKDCYCYIKWCAIPNILLCLVVPWYCLQILVLNLELIVGIMLLFYNCVSCICKLFLCIIIWLVLLNIIHFVYAIQ